MKFGITSELDGCHRGVALYDIKLAALGILGTAGYEFFYAVCHVCLCGELLFDVETCAFCVFAAALVDEDLVCDLFRISRVFNEIIFDMFFQIIGESGCDEFIVDGFFRLVFIRNLRGKAVDDENETVLNVLEGDLAFVFIIFAVVFQIFVDGINKRGLRCLFGGTAMLEKA